MTVRILYHAHCLDGLGAAWAANSFYKREGCHVKLDPVNYGEPLPEFEITDHLTFVDFCPTKDQCIELSANHKIVVIDHHDSAIEMYNELNVSHPTVTQKIMFFLDTDFSGAVLTFDTLSVSKCEVPKVLLHIQDRDLWKFELPDTNAVVSYLHGCKTIEDITTVMDTDFETILKVGRIRHKYATDMVNRIAAYNTRTVRNINGMDVLFIPCMYEYVSEVCDKILKETHYPVVCGYTHDIFTDVVKLSFRSLIKPNAKLTAEVFGGGGHANSAGAESSYANFIEMTKEPAYG